MPSIIHKAKGMIKSLFGLFPQGIRIAVYNAVRQTASPAEYAFLGHLSHELALRNLKQLGLDFKTILDIGAHKGKWSRQTAGVYPTASFKLFEALPDWKNEIEENCKGLDYSLHIGVVSAQSGRQVPFFQMGTGSSMYSELSDLPRTVQYLSSSTLDDLLNGEKLIAPILMKIDAQGAEMDILDGAVQTLSQVDMLWLEVSLLPLNAGAPLFDEVIAYLKQKGFLLWEIGSITRNGRNNVMVQMDAIFIRQDHELRVAASDFSKPFKVVAI
jgi:FkbM family methyltransferase